MSLRPAVALRLLVLAGLFVATALVAVAADEAVVVIDLEAPAHPADALPCAKDHGVDRTFRAGERLVMVDREELVVVEVVGATETPERIQYRFGVAKFPVKWGDARRRVEVTLGEVIDTGAENFTVGRLPLRWSIAQDDEVWFYYSNSSLSRTNEVLMGRLQPCKIRKGRSCSMMARAKDDPAYVLAVGMEANEVPPCRVDDEAAWDHWRESLDVAKRNQWLPNAGFVRNEPGRLVVVWRDGVCGAITMSDLDLSEESARVHWWLFEGDTTEIAETKELVLDDGDCDLEFGTFSLWCWAMSKDRFCVKYAVGCRTWIAVTDETDPAKLDLEEALRSARLFK